MTHSKVALITGASSGIGESFAYALAEQGYGLILTARRKDNLERIKSDILAKYKCSVYVIPCDLSKPEAPGKLFEDVYSSGMQVDLLINNAGYGLNGEGVDLDQNSQLEMIDLNCRSLAFLSTKFGLQMKSRKSGSIINVASIGGFSPTPYFAIYGATKAFVLSFSQALAEELKFYDVHVLALCPGATSTEFEQSSNFSGKMPPKWAFQTSEEVVKEGLIGLAERKTVVVTGRHNRLATRLQKFLPSRIVISAAAKSMKPIK